MLVDKIHLYDIVISVGSTSFRQKGWKMNKLVLFIAAMITAMEARAVAPSPKSRLIAALIEVESRGNDYAIGDRHMTDRAYGPLQIRKPCVDNVNRRFGTRVRVEDLIGNRSQSVWICQKYLEMYATRSRLGREPSEEDLARVWNGGPQGYKKLSTLPYWSKVKKALAQIKN
ncbi:MAG: hypothetical protein A3C06_03855 [Candidatus Taylorbacteria bacterium RIFCSPHIGHO2_02_FULL_46_13]|uniref:Transglycosylase SLT domain-containing protein n=1 Tax=Candidatus Taylorbacteria bacterium RIFCSPHIGHO2_02_FULL_46_13 TaxID=1802312 RepID=A0A1G2MQV4_9BACT|nr:MAG: hypothetical protein A3C06_03855 [Candidatus Taylorbacteria bacterium RIFCSPHIGHO2_02_FULL_46_13]